MVSHRPGAATAAGALGAAPIPGVKLVSDSVVRWNPGFKDYETYEELIEDYPELPFLMMEK